MPERVRRAAAWLFWGTLIVVFDFRLNGFDFMNDVLGMVLVVVGLRMARRSVAGPLEALFAWAEGLAVVGTVLTVIKEVAVGGELGPVEAVDFVVTAVGVVLCVEAMLRLARQEEELALARDWERARAWIVGAFAAGGLGWMVGGSVLYADVDGTSLVPLVIVLVVVGFIALVQFLIALVRTVRSAPVAALA